MMGKYKIIVYAISKNEESFVDRWYESMKEADQIYVLDTGSTDKTVEKLKSHNIYVKQEIINPWRFDIARNKSLDLVPLDADICICTDLDEVFQKGWREKLEESWNDKITRAKYNYNWYIDEDNNPKISYYLDKIHTRKNYRWSYPVHEILENTNNKESIITLDNITLNHYPDRNKSRSSYLPLLELAIKENPNDDRNMHYLGREYMYYNQNDKAIKTLKKHLKLESATWKDERCASMRFIARCYIRKNNYKQANVWYEKAIKEAPYLRDPYVEKALLNFTEKDYNKVIYLCNKALDIKHNQKTYINETFSYDHTIYDLLSLCYYYKNEKDLSLYYINKAIEINPKLDRLKENKKIYEKL